MLLHRSINKFILLCKTTQIITSLDNETCRSAKSQRPQMRKANKQLKKYRIRT